MAVDYYKKAIKRLEERRKSNPYIPMAKAELGSYSQEYGNIQRKLDTSLRVGGASPVARMQAAQSAQQDYERVVGNVYDRVNAQQAQRIDKISTEIDELKFKQDLAKQQEKERKDRSKKGLLQAGAQILGAGIGAAAAGPGGALEGASIGASLGGAAGSAAGAFIGDDVDPEMLMQGATDAINGFSGMAQLKQDRDLASAMKSFWGKAQGMEPEDLAQINIQANMLYQAGDIKGLMALYNSYGGSQ